MDTISADVVHRAADRLKEIVPSRAIVHTVLIQLDGMSGGASVTWEGFNPYPDEVTDSLVVT